MATCTVNTDESLLSARESAFLPNSLLACIHTDQAKATPAASKNLPSPLATSFRNSKHDDCDRRPQKCPHPLSPPQAAASGKLPGGAAACREWFHG